uniref:Coiled-coil domain-containing protein 93 n=1 Tax=Plectus sambesii TaxID=2011161 RepID=A0A914UQV6_9BILA
MAERLRELMAEHDVIRQKEREFKEKCRRELTEMDAEIDRLEQPFQVTEDRTAAVAEHSAAGDELQRRRLELADLNRKVAALQRRIDEVPSQTELNQYQKRFLELYNQVASKHRETKQFYTLHNTLLDVKAYMKREIDLLDNIYNVQGLATQESYKRSFVQNLEDILTGVKQNKTKRKECPCGGNNRKKLTPEILERIEEVIEDCPATTLKQIKRRLKENQ